MTDRPPYQRLAAEVRSMILCRDLAPGERLPSRRVLAKQHGCALETVARAMELLSHEGFITTVPGQGSFVRRQPLIHRYGSRRLVREDRPAGSRPFQAEVEREGMRAGQRVAGVEVLRPTADIAALLGVNEAEDVFCRHHELLADETTVALVDTYYRLSFVAGHPTLESAAVIEGGSHTYIVDVMGVKLRDATEEILAREPTSSEAAMLRLRQGEPVMRLLRTLYAADGVPVQVSDHRLAADKYRLYYDVPAT